MKIGIFGGSFNPIHKGHEKALRTFISQAELDRVLVIPSFSPPHKDIPVQWASFEDRCEMIELAVGDIKEAEVSHIEKRLFEESGKKSYTKVTLEHLKSQYKGEYYLYVGTDMFATLHSWYECRYIFDNAVISVMSRDGCDSTIEEYKTRYEKEYGARVLVLKGSHIDVSSTQIRDILDSEATTALLPDCVADYIRRNRIYRHRRSNEWILEELKSTLPEKRFLHTLSVEKEARYLAALLCPEFEEDVARAALLHDCTKYLTFDEHRKMLDDATEYDLKSPNILHALSGAVYTRELGEPLWRAVKYHTTGKPDMSLFEMIVFIADYIEERRTHENCIAERERLHKALNTVSRSEMLEELRSSVYRILNATVEYLTKKQVYIHPLTLDALDFYRTLKGEK